MLMLLLLLLLLLPPPTCDEKNESLRGVVEVFFLRGSYHNRAPQEFNSELCFVRTFCPDCRIAASRIFCSSEFSSVQIFPLDTLGRSFQGCSSTRGKKKQPRAVNRSTKEPTKFEPTSKISSMSWHSQDPPRFLFFFHGPIQTHLHSIILQTHVEDEFPQAAAAEQNTLSRQDTGCMLGHVFLTDENLQIGTSPFKWCSYRFKRWSAPLTRRPYWFSQKRN